MTTFVSWIGSIRDSIDDMHSEKGADGELLFAVGGTKFLTHMFALSAGLLGFGSNAVWVAVPAMLQKMGLDSQAGQLIMSMGNLPWGLKSLYAIVSDGVPVCHYKKRSYMLAWSLLGFFSTVALAFLPYSILSANAASLVLCFMLIILIMVTLSDSLTQGLYTQVAKAKGSSIIVLRSGMCAFAGFIVSLYGGYLNDMGSTGPQLLIMTTLPWVAFAVVVIALNFMGDEPLKKCCGIDSALANKHFRLFLLAVVLGCVTIFNAGFSLLVDGLAHLRVILTVVLVIVPLVMLFWATEPTIAKINMYLYLCRLCTVGLAFPLQQFYTTNPADCPPDENGELMNLPNFPFFIFNTVGGICSNVAIVLALYMFEKHIVHWNAQYAFRVTTFFQVVAGVFDLMNTTRFNQRLLSWTGLGTWQWHYNDMDADMNPIVRVIRGDDLSTYVLGTALLEPLIREIDGLPSTLLMSKLCPKGIETTMFAILIGFYNVGFSLSGQIGALFISSSGFNFQHNPGHVEDPSQPRLICDVGGDGQVDGLNGMFWTLLIGTILMPMLTIPLTWVLIPDKRLDDEFMSDSSVPLEDGYEAVGLEEMSVAREK